MVNTQTLNDFRHLYILTTIPYNEPHKKRGMTSLELHRNSLFYYLDRLLFGYRYAISPPYQTHLKAKGCLCQVRRKKLEIQT